MTASCDPVEVLLGHCARERVIVHSLVQAQGNGDSAGVLGRNMAAVAARQGLLLDRKGVVVAGMDEEGRDEADIGR